LDFTEVTDGVVVSVGAYEFMVTQCASQ